METLKKTAGEIGSMCRFSIKVEGKDRAKYNIDVDGTQYSGWGDPEFHMGDFIEFFYAVRTVKDKTYYNIIEDSEHKVTVKPKASTIGPKTKQTKMPDYPVVVASAIEVVSAPIATPAQPPKEIVKPIRVEDITIGAAVGNAKELLGKGAAVEAIAAEAMTYIEAFTLLKKGYGR